MSKQVINVNLILLEPVIVFWSVWGLRPDRELLVLPLAGLLMAMVGALGGTLLNRFLGFSPKKRATFLISSSLSNHGFTMGGFLCYLLFGETGLAMSAIFLSYFPPLIFLCVFPYARKIGTKSKDALSFMHQFKQIFLNYQTMPLYAMATAVVLQFNGIERPGWTISIDPLILVSVGLYYGTLGINFDLLSLRGSFRENAAMASIKFVLIPLSVYFLLKWMPLSTTIKQVIMVESLMPVAVYSVMTSILFDLDAKCASAMFVVNTLLFLVLIMPFLMM